MRGGDVIAACDEEAIGVVGWEGEVLIFEGLAVRVVGLVHG